MWQNILSLWLNSFISSHQFCTWACKKKAPWGYPAASWLEIVPFSLSCSAACNFSFDPISMHATQPSAKWCLSDEKRKEMNLALSLSSQGGNWTFSLSFSTPLQTDTHPRSVRQSTFHVEKVIVNGKRGSYFKYHTNNASVHSPHTESDNSNQIR